MAKAATLPVRDLRAGATIGRKIIELNYSEIYEHKPNIYKWIKRLFDIVASSIALVILSPVFLLTALAIVLEDGGPVFFTQQRAGKDMKSFKIYKFRSMYRNAEAQFERMQAQNEQTGHAFKIKDDPRITHVGRFIRRYSIDELPQLFNIIKGDISIVGPRAERPEIAAEYEKTLPEFALRLQVKAGLTGYAQVYGKYNTTPYDKLLMDLMYIGNASILEDIRIIFATVKILFLPESTEGVAEGQTTAMIKEK